MEQHLRRERGYNATLSLDPSVLELPKEIGSVLLEILNISPQEGELPDFLKKVSVLPIFRKLLSDTDHLVNYHPASNFPSAFKKMEKFERRFLF